MITNLWHLFVAFFRASNLGFGGGVAIIPLIQAEAVENYHWMTNAQFTDLMAVTNALPGPVAIKIAGYIGYLVASWPGVVVALAATVLPTLFIVVAFGTLLMKYAKSNAMKAMLTGVRPIVTALLAVVAIDTAMEAFTIQAPVDLLTLVIAAGAAVSLYFFKVHPAVLVALSMLIGYFIF